MRPPWRIIMIISYAVRLTEAMQCRFCNSLAYGNQTCQGDGDGKLLECGDTSCSCYVSESKDVSNELSKSTLKLCGKLGKASEDTCKWYPLQPGDVTRQACFCNGNGCNPCAIQPRPKPVESLSCRVCGGKHKRCNNIDDQGSLQECNTTITNACVTEVINPSGVDMKSGMRVRRYCARYFVKKGTCFTFVTSPLVSPIKSTIRTCTCTSSDCNNESFSPTTKAASVTSKPPKTSTCPKSAASSSNQLSGLLLLIAFIALMDRP